MKEILEDPVNPPSPSLLLLKRYFVEILRDLEVLELHQTGVSSHLMWRARVPWAAPPYGAFAPEGGVAQ